MGAFRYVLYAAVAVSLSVYLYRAYRRWIAPDTSPATAEPDLRPGPASVVAPPADTPPASRPKAKRGLGFTNPGAMIAEPDTGSSESLVQQVIREELARKRGEATPGSSDGTAGNARGGLFASAAARPSADRVSVSAALTGVRLPDDLVPLVGDGTEADPHHVTFISSSPTAAAIGQHLGDELERLGYAVRTETDTVAVATKGSVTLRVTLHPDAGHERVDGANRFPTAPANSVVVEFDT